jgi:uroporphyrinogen decarboxylase
VLSVDWRVDLAEIRKMLGTKIALQGNVDPAVLLAPHEKIREATLGAINSLSGHGHILNLGHGILQQTPVENAQLFIETGQRALLHHARPAALVR